MAKKTINIGVTPNDLNADPTRTALSKVNDNFDELYARPTGDMHKSLYDADNDGVVDSADKIETVDAAGNKTFYGKDENGNIGFHTVTADYNPPAPYATKAALLADQANQIEHEEYTVEDASDWTGITSGWATFQKVASNTASESDYVLREYEGMTSGGGSTVPVSKTGTNIVFTEDALYNEQAYLTSENLTIDLTGAVKGVCSIVYCDRYIPNISGEYYISGSIRSDKLNELWFFNNGNYIGLSVVHKSYLSDPSGTTIEKSNNQLTLSNLTTINATSYEILFSTTNDINTANAVPNYNGTDTSYTHTGLANGTTYYYWVKAKAKGYLDSDYFTISETPSANFDTTNLVAVYNNDETSGTTSADSYGTNDGTMVNITTGVPGKIGTAFRLNGTSSYIHYPGLADKFSGSFTILQWFKDDATASNFRLFQNRGNGALGTKKGFGISIYKGATADWGNTTIDDGAGNYISFPENEGCPSYVQDNNWHEVALTFDTTTGEAKLALDGVILQKKTDTNLIGVNLNTAEQVRAGASSGDNQYFKGDLDVTKVFTRVLSDAEIAEHYNNGAGKTI
jgi:hypothetical protein